MQPMLNTAITAAISAGKVINKAAERMDKVKVSLKSDDSFVSNVDKKVEEIVMEALLKAYPDHQILSEETGWVGKESDYVWIIDPIDGTHNFIKDFPHYCVSIALKHQGSIMCGVIYDPVRQDLFTAIKGRGAKLNDRRLRLDHRLPEFGTLMAIGFMGVPPQDYKVLEKLTTLVKDMRRSGSAALDLAYVAAGRLDAFLERDLKIWDIAAGVLLVREAGGIVCDIDGSENYETSGNVLAAHRQLIKPLLKNIV